MDDYSFLYYLVRILFGALAGFFAILFWSRSRDAAWVFMIIGTLVLYFNFIFELLLKIKLLIPQYFIIFGVPCFEGISLFLSIAPFILYSIGFIIMIARK